MYIPIQEKITEIEVKKSRFIAYGIPVEHPDHARERVKQLKMEYSDASHVVSAFLIGMENSQNAGYSDDGEPHGTAGRPVFEVLKGSGITNLLIAVVRYFGGTKLGTGGLVKAYGDAAKAIIQELETEEWISRKELKCTFDYSFTTSVKKLFEGSKIKLESEDFGTQVSLSLSIPEEDYIDFKDKITDLCNGAVDLVEEK